MLDHGHVRLVDHMGNDQSIVRAARVSYNAAWREGGDEKLIRYLWKNGHTSPFESVALTFDVKAPIFVMRQWMRHRTVSYNEISARYTELPEEFYLPELGQITTQHPDNKQMRTEEQNPKSVNIQNIIASQCKNAFFSYHLALTMGCPRELARTMLPLGTYSQMFATTNLLNLFRFLTLRMDSHAQYEIRVYAEAILELIRPIVPHATAAWETYK